MKDNVIPFPVVSMVRVDDTAVEQTVGNSSVNRLHELRHAFDEARKQWPLELSELPEQNRKQVASRKR